MRTDHGARFYELMSISVPDGSPEELIETSQAVAGYIEASGGRILRSSNDSPWGRRRLAYPIRHNSTDLRDGFYTLYHFELEPNRIEDVEREIKLNERIIRHLLLVLDGEPIFVEEEEDAPTDGETDAVDASTSTEGEAVSADTPASAEGAAVAEVLSAPESETAVDSAASEETVDESAQVESVDAGEDVVSDATESEPVIVDEAIADEVTDENGTAVTDEEK